MRASASASGAAAEEEEEDGGAAEEEEEELSLAAAASMAPLRGSAPVSASDSCYACVSRVSFASLSCFVICTYFVLHSRYKD